MTFVAMLVFWAGVHVAAGLNIAGTAQVEKIRSGEIPPIEVPFGVGFDFQAREAQEKRMEFFRTHVLINDKWEVRS